MVVEDLFEQLAADGVIYAEIRFAPLLHLERGLTPEQVVAAVDRATEASIRSSGIEARLILCTLRHFDQEQGLHDGSSWWNNFEEAEWPRSISPATKPVIRLTAKSPPFVTRSITAFIAPLMPARLAAPTAFGKRCASFNRPGSATACEASKIRR